MQNKSPFRKLVQGALKDKPDENGTSWFVKLTNQKFFLSLIELNLPIQVEF